MKKAFSRVGFALLALVIVTQLAAGIMAVVFHDFLTDDYMSLLLSVVISFAAMYGVALPVFLFIMKKIPNAAVRSERFKKLSLKQFLLLLLAGIGLAYASNEFTTIITNVLKFFMNPDYFSELLESAESMMNFPSYFPMIAYAVFVAPVMEELVFRKFLYKKLIGFGSVAYIAVSAVSFGFFHMNFSQILYAMLIGALLALIMHHTGNVNYCIVLHIVFNFIGSAVPILLATYMVDFASSLWLVAIFGMMAAGIVVLMRWYKKYKESKRRERIIRFFYPAVPYTGSDGQEWGNFYPKENGQTFTPPVFAPLPMGCRYSFDMYGRPILRYFPELDPPGATPEFYPDFDPAPGELTVTSPEPMFLNAGMLLFIGAAVLAAISAFLII